MTFLFNYVKLLYVLDTKIIGAGFLRKLLKEFKEFISKGNVLDLAVGVIIGTAFTNIVNSLVNDIFMPIVSFFTGGIEFDSLIFKLNEHDNAATLKYGNFISAIVNFLVIAIVVFTIVKAINNLRKLSPLEHKEEETKKKCPYCFSEIEIKATRCPHCTSMLEDSKIALEDSVKELEDKSENT